MTRLLLVRHAHHALIGKALAGRSSEVGLDARGIEQAPVLAQRLAALPVAAIYTSPQRRARETAAPLGLLLGIEPCVDAGLDEIDFGDWSGKSFDALPSDPQWPVWVNRRSVAKPPGGERFVDVQARVVAAIDRFRTAHPDSTIALVSHGDVIKAALAHALRLSLDDLELFDIAPASVSIIAVGANWRRVELVNGGVLL